MTRAQKLLALGVALYALVLVLVFLPSLLGGCDEAEGPRPWWASTCD